MRSRTQQCLARKSKSKDVEGKSSANFCKFDENFLAAKKVEERGLKIFLAEKVIKVSF